jgi:hypothetical protein
MRGITDGTLAADLATWTNTQNVVVPLPHSALGKPLCPACAEAGYVEVLYLSTISKRYSCTRKHLYASG